MQIGIFPAQAARGNDLEFLLSLLESQHAAEIGINIAPLVTDDDLVNFRGDCVHILLSGEPPSGTDELLKQLRVPYVCSISAIIPELYHRNRWRRAFIPRKEFNMYPRILAGAKAIFVHSPAAAWVLEHRFDIPPSAFQIYLLPPDHLIEGDKRQNFLHRGEPGPFMLTYAGNYSSSSNIHRLVQALERLNIPAVIVGQRSDSEYSIDCRALALRNPRLQVVDEDDQNRGVLQSALSACELFVDPTACGAWNGVVSSAVVLGKRSVVSSKAKLEPWFGECVEYVEPTSPELLHHGIVTALNKGPLPTANLISKLHPSSKQLLVHLVSTYSKATTSVGG